MTDLRHHGDAELAPGPGRPRRQRAGRHPAGVAARRAARRRRRAAPPTPTPRPARAAVAAAHGRRRGEVLLTAGAAEAFVLLARALRAAPRGRRAPAVHRAGGRAARRRAPGRAGAAARRRRLPARPGARARGRRPGRARQPDQPDVGAAPRRRPSPRWPGPAGCWWSTRRSPTRCPASRSRWPGARDLPGLLVVRSLTKTWGLAGLRVGYVLGPADLVARAGRAQPHWPVSTPALAALARLHHPGRARRGRGRRARS